MKKIVKTTFVLAGFVLMANLSFAQGNGHGKEYKDKVKEPLPHREELNDKGKKDNYSKAEKEGKEYMKEKEHEHTQGKGHEKNHGEEREFEQGKDKVKDKEWKGEKGEHQGGKPEMHDGKKPGPPPPHGDKGEGHGYGKDKGNLEGRDFGQHRAEEAKMNKENKAKELDGNISTGEDKVLAAKEKINASKQKLEENKKAGKINDTQYKEELQKINRAEEAVKNLENSLQKGKELNMQAK